MDYKKLGFLNDNLRNMTEEYISMIAIGSIATGDPWMEGRSDRDILLVFNQNPSQYSSRIKYIADSLLFNPTYIFTAIKKEEFTGPENSSHDFSHKFRSQILFGADLIGETRLPERERIFEIYSRGIREVTEKLEKKLHYGKLWPVGKIRDVFWKQFKHAFMYLAIKHYYETGYYPKTKQEVADILDSKELQESLRVLHSIDQQPKEEIEEIAKGLLSYLRD